MENSPFRKRIARREIEYRVRLSSQQVLSQITESVDQEGPSSLAGLLGTKPFIGKIDGNTFRIKKRRHYWNGFVPLLYGHVEPVGEESLITVQIQTRRLTFATIWMTVWTGLAGLFSIVSMLVFTTALMLGNTEALTGVTKPIAVAFILVPVLLLVCGVWIIKSWKHLANVEEMALGEFVGKLFGEGETKASRLVVARPFERHQVIGWLMTGIGLWSALSIYPDWRIFHSQNIEQSMKGLPLYQVAVNFRSLPEFYPTLIFLSVLMAIAGFGLLRQKVWARSCAILCICLAAIGSSSLNIRYLLEFSSGRIDPSILGMWLLSISFLGVFAFYLLRPARQ